MKKGAVTVDLAPTQLIDGSAETEPTALPTQRRRR